MMIELVLLSSFVVGVLYIINEFRVYYHIKTPEITFKNTSVLYHKLLETCESFNTPYIPTFWAPNGHLQTWLKTVVSFHDRPKISSSKEYLQMQDEGIISIEWVSHIADSENAATTKRRRSLKKKAIFVKEKPILMIIPSALNTNVQDYTDLCLHALLHGFKPLFFNRRGYASNVLTTPKVTTYNDHSDLEETLKYLNSQLPFSSIYAIAFSMESGNLISYLGHEKTNSLIAGAVCVSSTFGCENQLKEHAMKQPYNAVITEKIKTIFQSNAMCHEMFDSVAVQNCQTMVSLQNEIHARSNQYQTLKEYLNYNSPLIHLNRIQVPVLFIHAKDDPVIPENSVPYEFFGISDWCILLTTEYGGHCGFFKDFAPTSWADNRAIDFLKFINKNGKICSMSNGHGRSRAMTIF